MLWKLPMAVLSEELYMNLQSKCLLPNEQKGCRRNSTGTKDKLLIDKMIIRNCKRRLTGLGMAWIDFKKAFDMVPHSWLVKCLDLFGAANSLMALLEQSRGSWCTELTADGQVLGEVDIQRGIFPIAVRSHTWY